MKFGYRPKLLDAHVVDLPILLHIPFVSLFPHWQRKLKGGTSTPLPQPSPSAAGLEPLDVLRTTANRPEQEPAAITARFGHSTQCALTQQAYTILPLFWVPFPAVCVSSNLSLKPQFSFDLCFILSSQTCPLSSINPSLQFCGFSALPSHMLLA